MSRQEALREELHVEETKGHELCHGRKLCYRKCSLDLRSNIETTNLVLVENEQSHAHKHK